MKENNATPFPGGPGWKRKIAAEIMQPLFDTHSGELSASIYDKPIGAARTSARVSDFWISVKATGTEDCGDPLQVSGELYINGTTCLSTKPCVTTVSGESSQNKTTKATGDTGITQAVIDADASSLTPGDVLTYDLIVSRTTPTAEITDVVVCVEFEPVKI